MAALAAHADAPGRDLIHPDRMKAKRNRVIEPSDFSRDSEASSPVSAELAVRAVALIAEHPECFWFWRPDAGITSIADLRLVVQHLRQYGDRRAWWAAQELHQSLLQSSKETS